jgi:hypothetical protein
MSNGDKTKLDGIANGATNVSFSTNTPAAIVVGGSGSAGSTLSASKYDHVHPFPAFGTTFGTICQGNDSRFTNIAYLGGSITLNYLTMFTGSTTIGNAPIYASSGSLRATGNFFCDGYIQSTNFNSYDNSSLTVGTSNTNSGTSNVLLGNGISVGTTSSNCTAIGINSSIGTGNSTGMALQGTIYNNTTLSAVIHTSTSSSYVFWIGSKNDFRITTTTPDDLIQAFVTSGRTIPLGGTGLGIRVRVDGGGSTMGLFAVPVCGVYVIYGQIGL